MGDFAEILGGGYCFGFLAIRAVSGMSLIVSHLDSISSSLTTSSHLVYSQLSG